jgi:hypothetical protein
MATNTPTKRNSVVYADSVTITGNITAPSYHNSNWDTAYGWGNHASAGYLTSIPTPISSNWWNGYVGVGGDGVMEMGKYMDFHTTSSGGNNDYDLRVTVSPGVFSVGGQVNATGGNSGQWSTAYGWGNHATQNYATQNFVNSAVSNLVASAPGTLDTLNELAAALGDDPNFAVTVSNNIGSKVSKAGDTMTGTLTAPTGVFTNLTVGTSNKIKFANNDYIRYDDANGVGRFHFDSDGGTNNASVQAATFVGALSGNASTSSRWATTRTNTVTLTGDVTGSGSASVDGSGNWTVSVPAVVANDSHTHDGRYVQKTGDTMTGNLYMNTSSQAVIQKLSSTSNYGAALKWFKGGVSNHTFDPQIGHHNTGGDGTGSITILPYGTGSNPWDGTVGLFVANNAIKYKNQNIFHDNYHPNADKWTTPRSHTVTLTGAVTGSASQSVDGTGNRTWTISTDLAGGFGDLYTYNVNMGLSISWADIPGIAGSVLPTGTYAIQIKVYNSDAGGGNYDEHYSGTMAWYGSSTNDNDSNEIPLHNAGHASNGSAIYARTLRRYSSNMVLQLAASSTVSADDIEIKIRRLI